ncbi:unnamed protein product [Paramecium primaurelia]|uniref:Peptidase C51 domain-containing protein n=1 Tax=Paramecium primaurelia TaxID=5886 RepID=A0A8S1KWQ1_PARPR|nr:unnamed protein product [Paramecium primaurelia]
MIFLLLTLTAALRLDCKDQCDGDHYCYLGQCYSCFYFRKQWESQIPDFGVLVGKGNGVPAYSCQNDMQHIDELQHFLQPNETGFNQTVYVGMRYQCVHFARNYWIQKYGSAFPDVDTADQIFNLTYAIDYKNGKYRNLTKFYNGRTTNIRSGDLLIWNKREPYFPYGHVAVVLDVQLGAEEPFITIGEQNYDDIWDSNQYARKLKVSLSNFGLVYIINEREITGLQPQEKCKDYDGSADDVIVGWVRLND